MSVIWPGSRTASTPALRSRLVRVYGFLTLLTGAAWITALVVLPSSPAWLGLMFVVYGLGLRHAVDADHIAAIDNVTRKLMQDGSRPVTVGLYFALGHSAVVLIVTILVAHAARTLERMGSFRQLGEGIGVAISTLFLFVIAAMNLVIFVALFRSYRRRRAGGGLHSLDRGEAPAPGGPLSRLLQPLFALVTRSWHMFPVGFLFGLGFDTATEVAVFTVSITQAAHGMSLWVVLLFPLLFAAGMALADTTDGVVMLQAYAWAFVDPMRKTRYNMSITLLSAVIALVVGSIEALGLLGERFGLAGGAWNTVASLNTHLTGLGLLIIGLILLVWALSYVPTRWSLQSEA
ncbi:MAG: HoxN/HupN/NixA family nickel/cobalt transporter [Gammaproteobacteria bacterium]|nr:HoxN/HupN/NixA family nickel/cobalt transporter [Gammaproteobacteria bacterium]